MQNQRVKKEVFGFRLRRIKVLGTEHPEYVSTQVHYNDEDTESKMKKKKKMYLVLY